MEQGIYIRGDEFHRQCLIYVHLFQLGLWCASYSINLPAFPTYASLSLFHTVLYLCHTHDTGIIPVSYTFSDY